VEDFDEIDVAISLDADRDLVLTMTLEKGSLERMMFGWAPAGDDDADARPFTEEELAAVLASRGDQVTGLLEYLS
jgi:hypothetical protein